MRDKPSNWYYLLPIFLNLIGGIIMYFVLKTKDKEMARNGLLLGVVLLIVHIGLGMVLNVI